MNVLLSTDVLAERLASRVPGLEIGHVRLCGQELPSAADLARVTVACLSTDAFPERYRLLMRACRSAPHLRWLHTFSAGVDRPVFHELRDRGVVLTTSSGSAAVPIAQTVLMYLLALTRDLPRWVRAQAAHQWDQRRIVELEGRTVGVVGYGPIGAEVVRLVRAFGMEPIVVRRQVRGDEPCETWPLGRLPDLVRAVDVLVLALPLTVDTEGLIDAELIAAMRPGALLVNVGRGALLDEDALVEALRTRRLGGAGLDVFTTEPLPPDSPLWDLDNVIITPHSSGHSDRAEERATEIFVENLERWHDGRPLLNRA